MRIIQLILKFLIWLWTATNFAKWWSSLYRWIYERKIITAFPKFNSMSDLVQVLSSKHNYSRDGLKELWDVFHSEEYISNQISKGLPIGDCGSFALLAAKALKSSKFPISKDEIKNLSIMTVFWFEKPNSIKMGAHNVCLIEYKSGEFAHMDYGFPKNHNTKDVAVVAADVAKKFSNTAQVVSWSIRDLNLKLIKRS